MGKTRGGSLESNSFRFRLPNSKSKDRTCSSADTTEKENDHGNKEGSKEGLEEGPRQEGSREEGFGLLQEGPGQESRRQESPGQESRRQEGAREEGREAQSPQGQHRQRFGLGRHGGRGYGSGRFFSACTLRVGQT